MKTSAVDGRTVAITGGSSGIGAATAKALVDHGAHVVLGARRRDRLEQLAAETDGNVTIVEMDVRSAADCERLVEAALGNTGRLDALIASAGIGAYGGIMDLSDDQLGEMMETNVHGTVWSVRAAVPALRAGGGGDIVVVASVAGLRGGAVEAVYAATKYAQIGLAGALDRELREHGIRVTSICPATTQTEFAIGAGRTPDMPGLDAMLRAEDVAEAIVTILRQPQRIRTHLWSMYSMAEQS